MIVARSLNVTEDVFWYVRGRDGDVDRTASEWLSAFLEDNKRRVEDASYARAAKRVAMTEAKRNPPPSARKRRAKVA